MPEVCLKKIHNSKICTKKMYKLEISIFVSFYYCCQKCVVPKTFQFDQSAVTVHYTVNKYLLPTNMVLV